MSHPTHYFSNGLPLGWLYILTGKLVFSANMFHFLSYSDPSEVICGQSLRKFTSMMD